MNLTQQGNEVMADLFSRFSNYYGEQNPGCNQNDVERAFLVVVAKGVYSETYGKVSLTAKNVTLIGSIR